MDMSLHEVRTLLALDWSRKEDCDAARDTLDDHLQHVRARLAELQTLEADLLALRNRCDGTDAHCHIIEALHARADAQPAVPFATAAAKRHV
jgi:DNA-binding transcriptional MerR regulator